MGTLKDIITGRQSSTEYRKNNFKTSGAFSGDTVYYTGDKKNKYKKRNFDAQNNAQQSIRDIVSGKDSGIKEYNVSYYPNSKKIAAINKKTPEEKLKNQISSENLANVFDNKLKNYKSDIAKEQQARTEYQNQYKDYDYKQLKTAYDQTNESDKIRKKWLKEAAYEKATSSELKNEYDSLIEEYKKLNESDKGTLTTEEKFKRINRAKYIESETKDLKEKIKSKELLESAEKENQFNNAMLEKYGNYTYAQLIKETEKYDSKSDESKWLKNAAYEKATSKELQEEYDKLTKEYNSLYDSRNEEKSYNRLKEIEKKQEEIEPLIENKKYNEKKKTEYDDVVNGDVRIKTLLQKYYSIKKYEESVLNRADNGNAADDIETQSDRDAYDYAKSLSYDDKQNIIKQFNQLKNKDTLYKYFKREMEDRETQEENKFLQDYSDNHPIAGSAASIALNTYGTVSDTAKYVGAGLDKAFGGDGYINADNTNAAKAEVIRDTVSKDMNGVGKFLYGTGMSIGENIARMPMLALPGGEAINLALAGTSAGISSANDVINSGGSIESALLTGAAAGAAEGFFEKISLDKLIDLRKKGTESVFREVLNQMKTEGLEEVGTDIANAITDQIINGDMSQISQNYNNYIKNGYSEKEAWQQTAADFGIQVGLDFLGGAISGGVLSGGTLAINYVDSRTKNMKSASQLGTEALNSEGFNINELITAAKQSDNQKAVKLANAVEKDVEKKGADKISNVDVGNLLVLTNPKLQYDYTNEDTKTNVDGNTSDIKSNEKSNYNSNDNSNSVNLSETKAFGNKHPHGVSAKTIGGERINVVGIKSSSKDVDSDENKVVLLADDGNLYDSDDVNINLQDINQLVDYSKNFGTNGARKFVSQYEVYEEYCKRQGIKADTSEYANDFDRLYNLGKRGATYNIVESSGMYSKEIRNLGVIAKTAVNSGNEDFDIKTQDETNKVRKLRIPGQKNTVNSKVTVENGSEQSVRATDEQIALLQAVAEKVGKEIVLTDKMYEKFGEDNLNGAYYKGKIYINSDVNSEYMLSVALHEATHAVRQESPEDYYTLCKFITNYLTAKGENIEYLIDDIKRSWSDYARDEDAALEELVCQTVMVIATDENAIKTALSLEENKGILQKVANVLKRIAKSAYDFIKGVGGKAHNRQAQAWLDDVKAINELAERLEKAFENTRKLNEQRASAAENTETEQKNNTQSDVKFSIRLSDSDLNDYLKAGNRKNKIKLDQIAEGKSIILTNENDIIDYIDDSISGNKKEEIMAYGKANKQLVSEILRETNESVDVSNYYLELPSDNLFHAYREHSRAKKINNIPLSKEDFEKIPEYFDRHDELLYVRKYASGVTSVCVSKNISNGKILIIETVSKSRGALQFKNAFGLNEEGYIEFLKSHGLKNKISSPSSGGSENSNTMSLPNGTAYNSTLSQNKSSVNDNSMQTNKNNTKNSVDDTIDDYSDLTALDDEEIKVYNKRGWTYKLFTKEDRILLREKFNEPDSKITSRTDNVLGDGSRIVEVNNKIVLIGGTFAEPEIYCVFAINAANETEADIYKEWFYRDSNEFKQSKEEFANNCKCYESSLGKTFVRAYVAVDFSYYKGHKDYGERAVLPSSFKNYGYTEQFQDGAGDNPKAGRDVSEIKLAVDDTIIDYLAEEYGKPKSRADFQKIIEENPNAAILMMYRNSIETAQKGLYLSESIKLPEESYRKIARKVLIDMGVKVNNYGSAVGRLAESIKHIVEKTEEVAKARVVSGPGYFRNLFENFAKACSDYVKLSSRYNENYRKNVRDYVNGLISNNVLVVRDDDIELIKKNYGSVTEFRSRMNGKTKVGMAKNGRTGYYIEDVADWVYKKYPKLVKATRDKDGVWHWSDKDGGFRWFDMLVNDYLEPKLDTRVESSTVKGYYEDRQSAGFESALNAINCVLREKVKVGVNEKRIERSLVKELDNEAEQSTNELKELKWAKYRIEELRKRNRKLNAELNKGMSAIREEYYEARMKTVERNKLIRKLNKFIKLFENGKSSKNYVPDVLQKPILDVLKMIEMNAGTYKNGKQKATPKTFDRYTQKLSDIDRAVTELTEKYETLKEKQVSNSSDVEFSFFDINTLGFEEETMEMLKNLQEQVKGRNVYELSSDDLRTIYDTINELDGALKRAVEVIIDGQKTTVQEAALQAIEEIGGLKVKKGGSGIKGTIQMVSNQAAISSLDSERFSRYISGYHDDYVIRKIINELHNGEKKVQRIKQAGYIKVTSVLSKYSNKEVKHLQKGDVVEFDFTDIDTNKRVKVSPSMLMGIYLTVKQEDGLRHIINEDPNRYLSLPDLDLLNKNNPISDLRQDNRRAVESERHRVRLSEEDISHINNYIETNAMLKELCNAIMVVFNEQIATEINNVSLQTQGRKIAVVKNYYPLSVDPDCPKCKTDWEFTSVFKDQRIKNKGFTKNRTYSILPLRIDDAMSVFSKHISETAEYCGLLVPLTNFMKIYRNGSDTDTVKSIIKKTYGEPAIHYINKFIGDLQKSDNTDNNLFLKWQGKYMGAKLLANPGAMIQQFSAFPLANKYFGTKNVAAAATVGFNKIDFDLYAKYTTYLWYRKQGNGTILGEVSKEVGFYKKLTDYLDIMGKLDRLVVGRLLYAAELHVEQTTDLKRGTDAFYKEVVRQFEKCVDETQPNNMITSKPQFIRNNVMRALSFSAFRSQVMAVGNCIIDSFGEYNARRAEYNEIKTEEAKAAKKEAAKNFLKVLIGAAISFVLGGILKCIADIILRHKYDDIKDEKGNITFANIAWKFADESLENLASSFIWGDKLYEIGATMIDLNRYFGLEVMSVETVNDGVEKAKKGDWFAIAALLIDGFGYPAENMLRYGRSIIAYINDISNGYGEIITKNNSTENNTSYFNFIIVEAKQKGETEKAEHFEQLWKDDLINKQGKTEEKANEIIKQKIVTALAVSDDDVEQAALAKANGDLSSYENHINKVVGYGFDSVDVKKAVDKVIKNIADDAKNRGLEEKSEIIADLKNQGFNDKGAEYVYKNMQNDESKESKEETSVFDDTSEGKGVAYTYEDAFEYLKNGDKDNYERVEKYLIDNNKDKTKNQIVSSIRSSSRTDKLWKEYFDAQNKNEKEKLEEYKTMLINIYGTWNTATYYGRKYLKKEEKKQENQ